MFRASDYFSVEGALYLYLDTKAAADTGALTEDTLATPAPTVFNSLTGTTDLTGALVTASTHAYRIAGTLSTSHGTVATTVDVASVFKNTQTYAITPSTYVQDVVQDTETGTVVTTRSAGGVSVASSHFSYPLAVDVGQTGTNTDTILQTTKVGQGLLIGSAGTSLAEGILSQDTVPFVIDPSTGTVTLGANSGAASAAFYGSSGAGACAGRLLASAANVLEVETQASDCATAAMAASMEGAVTKGGG